MSDDLAIEVKDLVRVFESRKGFFYREKTRTEALKGVQLVVRRGTIFGLLGPNGAGKTTLTKILSTLLLPTSGTVRILDHEVVEDAHWLRSRIGLVLGGERGLYNRINAKENLRYFADLYGIPQPLLSKILQKLAKNGFLQSEHGTNGGYRLARAAHTISAFEVIQAIDGPLFITSCVTVRGECDQTDRCTIREPLRRVNQSLEDVLRRITISHMKEEAPAEEKPESKKPVDLVSIT